MLCFADPNDPEEEPFPLFFFSAQNGLIDGMEKAMSKDPKVLFMIDTFMSMSALHAAAASPSPNAVVAVRWLLKKGIPWSAEDIDGRLAENLARMHGNEESWTVLRNWAIDFEYELYYRSNREEDHPDGGKPFRVLRMDKYRKNREFCNSLVTYLDPHAVPDDGVALIAGTKASGVMMEWERPIMRETARLLLDGMPTGLRVLNIGFGVGMIDTYFQDAQPAEHVIIEGHPTCRAWMRQKGWYDRPGVRVLEGRWQDFLPSESPEARTDQTPKDGGQTPNIVNIGKFDVVYFDTFEEGYRGHFAFIKNVPGLLRGPGSRFSYFHAHASRNVTLQAIYAEVARLHHNDLGLNTEYFSVHVDPKTRWYHLKAPDLGVPMNDADHIIPICALAPTVPRRIVPKVGWKK